MRYVELSGLERILTFLQNMNTDVRQSQLHYTFVGCIKALMNNSVWKKKIILFLTATNIINDFELILSGGESSRAGPSCWDTDYSTEFEDN